MKSAQPYFDLMETTMADSPAAEWRLVWGRTIVLVALLLVIIPVARGQGWETALMLPEEAGWPTSIFLESVDSNAAEKPLLMLAVEYSTNDLVAVNLAEGTSQSRTVLKPWQGVFQLGYDPSTASLFALSRFDEWTVLRSTDRGISWSKVDALAANTDDSRNGPRCFVRDDQGALYVAGNLGVSSSSFSWTVRKSVDQGTTWRTVHQLANATGGRGLFVPGPRGGLFVVGTRGASGWVVRRSRDGGVTWNQVDAYSKSGKATSVRAITSDPQGRVFVAGSSSPDPARWEVRLTENGGDTWQTISPPAATAEFNSNIGGIAVDPAGTLWIAGTLDAWAIARRTSDGVWTNIEFPFGIEAGWVASLATAITIDSGGNVYAGGTVRERHDEITSRMVLQKLPSRPRPQLGVVASENTLLITWPSWATDFQLESSTADIGVPAWELVGTPPVVVGDEKVVIIEIGARSRFFRLQKP